MTTEDQGIVLSLIQEEFEKQQFPTEVKDTENGPMLRMRIPLLENGAGQVLVEVCALTYNDQIDIIQIYSTMLPQPGPGLEALRAKLNEWNLVTIAGAYGIYDQLGQFYHKYNVAVDVSHGLEDKADQAILGICVALDEMSGRIEEAMSISVGRG